MQLLPLLGLLVEVVPLVAAQDFGWVNTQLSEVLNYESVHFSECSAYPAICPPLTQSCAQTLCANCPKYYNTCCLSAATPVSCFQSLHDVAVGTAPPAAPTSAATTTTGAGAGGAAVTTNAVQSTAAVGTTEGSRSGSGSGSGSRSGSVTSAATFPITSAATATVATATTAKTGMGPKVGGTGEGARVWVGVAVVVCAGVLAWV